MFINSQNYFGAHEYLLADSAYVPGPHVVPAFKASAGRRDPQKNAFNERLSRPRVKCEHCIGLLKGRFPWLKNIRILIKGTEDLRAILRFVQCAVIIHNAAIDSSYEKEWINEDFDRLDDPCGLADILKEAVVGDERRQQLMHFFSEAP
jgi:hypothetical protein